jgi:hypothetical protein
MNKASYLSLVSNAILVWNTPQIARIVETLRQTGTHIADEDLEVRLAATAARQVRSTVHSRTAKGERRVACAGPVSNPA